MKTHPGTSKLYQAYSKESAEGGDLGPAKDQLRC